MPGPTELKVGRPLKLRSIRFKNGGEIRLLPIPASDLEPAYAKERIGRVVDALAGPVAGFAIVAWGPDGKSTALMHTTKASLMPSMMIPEFVRNRLLADQIERWTIESVREDEG